MNIPEILVANGTGIILVVFLFLLRVRNSETKQTGAVLYDGMLAVTLVALVTETIDPIERGMPVTLMDRRFILERPKPNQANVIARIIGSAQPRRLLAYGNVVFLDAGDSKGIVPGNRFFVIRRGDNWQDALTRSTEQMGSLLAVPKYNKEELPKEVVAELRVPTPPGGAGSPAPNRGPGRRW